ncbi:MAG TPA: pteridine-dependent deoxygenase [Rudaea sp.]|nr:pteridine-dependent deoxygenase [Rudaea sp.]
MSHSIIVAMTVRPSHALESAASAALAPLRVEYSSASATVALAQSGTLAVIGFGNMPQALDDPRLLRVRLHSEAPAPLEIWRTSGRVAHDRDGELAWSSDGDYAFVALNVDEAAHGGINGAAQRAYAILARWSRASATPHFLRIWNYLDAINEGSGDAERYRQFCAGRAAGMNGMFGSSYPAATAIGLRDGQRVLQVYALAARLPGCAVENPRQVNAWRYPRQYGPAAPGFARAMRAPTAPPQLYISGTAAIVGHASHHPGDLTAQLDETLANVHSLLDAAGSHASLDAQSPLKVYVRHAPDMPVVRDLLRARLGDAVPLLLLEGDICRRELLLEIEGIHAG